MFENVTIEVETESQFDLSLKELIGVFDSLREEVLLNLDEFIISFKLQYGFPQSFVQYKEFETKLYQLIERFFSL